MHPTIDELRSVPAFGDQTQETLEWLASLMEVEEHEAGKLIAREGEIADRLVVVLEGEIQGRRENDGMDTTNFVVPAGMVTGKLPYSRMVTYPMSTRATVKTRLAYLHDQYIFEMVYRMPDVASRLIWAMLDRARETTTQEQVRDKMAALGKISAGIAHELNNPASAAKRAASNIRDALADLRSAERHLASYPMQPDEYCALAEVEEELASRAREAPALDALERSDREQTIGVFLEEHGVENAWELAGSLVDANFCEDHLTKLSNALSKAAVGPALTRLSASVTLARLAEEIDESSTRISALVKAIKEYSHMDRTPDQPVDVHRSLETTLAILNHELKHGVKVVREYDAQLPIIEGFGSELNQVWTNLISNAADAMEGKGELRIRTGRELDGIFVEIADNGPGIPDDIQRRIFEPFFTTKKIGEGTGLGLPVVRKIVNKHHGIIRLESKPGDTKFHLWLPLKQEGLASTDALETPDLP